MKYIFLILPFLIISCSGNEAPAQRNPEYCWSGPIYCYSSLGSAMCYTSPLNNQEHRLVAVDSHTRYNVPQKCINVENLYHE